MLWWILLLAIAVVCFVLGVACGVACGSNARLTVTCATGRCRPTAASSSEYQRGFRTGQDDARAHRQTMSQDGSGAFRRGYLNGYLRG